MRWSMHAVRHTNCAGIYTYGDAILHIVEDCQASNQGADANNVRSHLHNQTVATLLEVGDLIRPTEAGLHCISVLWHLTHLVEICTYRRQICLRSNGLSLNKAISVATSKGQHIVDPMLNLEPWVNIEGPA